MSFSQDVSSMDQASRIAGSVSRANEQAVTGLSREEVARSVSPPISQEENESWAHQQTQAGGMSAGPGQQIGIAISRSIQELQWPLGDPLPSNYSMANYRSAAGRVRSPQRPPRPSQVPSLPDGSLIQDLVPSALSFQRKPQRESQSERGSASSVPQTPSSRPSTQSSVVSIPDFPLPVAVPMGPPRRSVDLGPPPSSRRGASSFYSNAPHVSPIPEESPTSRSQASYASSAAIPDSWAPDSSAFSAAQLEDFLEEQAQDSSGHSGLEFGEESQLVPTASIGKRRAHMFGMTASPNTSDQQWHPSFPQLPASPIRPGAFMGGARYAETSSSSSRPVPASNSTADSGLTPDRILDALEGAASSEPVAARQMATSPRGFSRLSAIRRPPRLDMEAVREAESRGSLTSLPDLIRRATRLAAMMDNGRRPGSRIEVDDFPEDVYGRDSYPAKEPSAGSDKHQSGLSDMLAAFPPPAQAGASSSRHSLRQSFRRSASPAWPLPFRRSTSSSPETAINVDGPANGSPGENIYRDNNKSKNLGNGHSHNKSEQEKKHGRPRVCGLPVWGFVVVFVIALMLIAAAIVIPVQLLVLQNRDDNTQTALDECQSQLNCANGGTNVISQGICSCICTNGFTGSDCSIPGSTGCITATISSTDLTNTSNVTLGQAIPRLIESSQANFSIPLSATAILAKLNAGNLSCASQNALVTFDGRSMPGSDAPASTRSITQNEAELDWHVVGPAANQLLAVILNPGRSSTLTVNTVITGLAYGAIITAPARTRVFVTTVTFSASIPSKTGTGAPVPTKTSTIFATTTRNVNTATAPAPLPPGSFVPSSETFDFARVAVLFVLEQQTLTDAANAQRSMQRFFSTTESTGSSITQAMNVTAGGSNSVDLVNFRVDVGDGPLGRKLS